RRHVIRGQFLSYGSKGADTATSVWAARCWWRRSKENAMRPIRLLRALVPFLAGVLLMGLLAPSAPAGLAAATTAPAGALERYAQDTWASFVAMVDDSSGLPTDKLHADGSRDVQTSTTNIGAYLWSTLVAERLGIIGHQEVAARLSRTTSAPEDMERCARGGARVDSMDFGFYYRPDVNRILFHYAPDTGDAPCCYDTIVSESRIASYLGIAKGEIPPREYFGTWRSFPDSCDWSWQETRPV